MLGCEPRPKNGSSNSGELRVLSALSYRHGRSPDHTPGEERKLGFQSPDSRLHACLLHRILDILRVDRRRIRNGIGK